MKGISLFVLLSSLWNGGIGVNNTMSPWTTPKDGNSQKVMSSVSDLQNKTQTLQTKQNTPAEKATTPETRTSEEGLLKSTLLPSETSVPPQGMRNQTLVPTEKTEEAVMELQSFAVPTKSRLEFSPAAQSVVLSNSTLKFLQSFARKSNQQDSSLNSVGGVDNRSPRETYLSRGDSSRSRRTDYQKSSFETTRGK